MKVLELNGSMDGVVYVNEVGSIYIWNIILEGIVEDKDANEYVQLKGVKFYLGWLQLVVTVGAYSTNKFLRLHSDQGHS